jgi:hypothetical protein
MSDTEVATPSRPAHGAICERAADAVATTVGDRLVLYHRVSRTAIVLNPTGVLIWEHLDGRRNVADLATSLQAHYPTLSHADASRDVDAFLASLVRHAFITPRA